MGSLGFYEELLGKNGLMIPVYSNMGLLDSMCQVLMDNDHPSDSLVEDLLARVYNPNQLAAMVLNRYPKIPIVCDYKISIAESIEAHFLGLDHVAVAGLMPVVEGVGRSLYEKNGLGSKRGNGLVGRFQRLTEFAICDITKKKLGDYLEVESMLASFQNFLKTCFFSDSDSYPLSDKTNRNGIFHGVYTDKDYGSPLNFYKTLGAVDMLCLISNFQVFQPKPTPESEALASYYFAISHQAAVREKLWGEVVLGV